MFLSEVLYKSVKEEGESSELFSFLQQSMKILDAMESNFENFHLQFLVKLSRLLGFGVDSSPGFMLAFHEEEIPYVRHLLDKSYSEKIAVTVQLRRTILDHILDFYRQHVEGLREIRSIDVLREVL